MSGKRLFYLCICVFSCLTGGTAEAEAPHTAPSSTIHRPAATLSPLERQVRELARLLDADAYATRVRAERDLRELFAQNFASVGQLIAVLRREGLSLQVDTVLRNLLSSSESSFAHLRLRLQDQLAAAPETVASRVVSRRIYDQLLARRESLEALASAYREADNDVHVERRRAMYTDGQFNEDFDNSPRVLKARKKLDLAVKALGRGLRASLGAAGVGIAAGPTNFDSGYLSVQVTHGGRPFRIRLSASSVSVTNPTPTTIALRDTLTPLQYAGLGIPGNRVIAPLEIETPVVHQSFYAYQDGNMSYSTHANVSAESRDAVGTRLRDLFGSQHRVAIDRALEAPVEEFRHYPGLSFQLSEHPPL